MKKKITILATCIAILAAVIMSTYFMSLEKSDGTYTFHKVKHRVYEVTKGSDYVGDVFTIKNGVEFEYHGEIFKYSVQGYRGDYILSVTYPNGGSFEIDRTENGGSTGQYGMTYSQNLIQSFAETVLVKKTPMYLLGAALLMLFGVMSFFAPELVFYLAYGWRFRKADASDFMISVTRIEGVASMIISVAIAVYYFV